jgi:hypothetical protein
MIFLNCIGIFYTNLIKKNNINKPLKEKANDTEQDLRNNKLQAEQMVKKKKNDWNLINMC